MAGPHNAAFCAAINVCGIASFAKYIVKGVRDMLDGTYDVKLSTPMGVKKGELTLASSGQVLNGTMLVMGKTNSFEGTTNENSFCFEGELKTAVGLLAYTCEGSVKDHALSGVVTTKKGKFTLGGTRK